MTEDAKTAKKHLVKLDALGRVLAIVMPRRSKFVDYKYPSGYVPGNIVVVTAPDIFKGEAIGFVVNPIKWCPEGITVYVPDATYPRYLCIQTERGHSIKKATK